MVDWDELLAYDTIKIVRVKDRYLGILRILFLLAIFGYIVGYVLIYSKKYLNIEIPIGSIRTSLQKVNATTYPYKHSYCSQYELANGGYSPYFDVLNCKVWDEYQTVFPAEVLDSIFVTTKISRQNQVAMCVDLSQPCVRPWVSVDNDAFYLCDVESGTIKIEHSMISMVNYKNSGNDPQYAGSNRDMTGKLVDISGNTIQTFGLGMDIMTVDIMLTAAGVNLSDISDVLSDNGVQDTYRNTGTLLLFTIDYSNIDSSSTVYTYSVSKFPSSETTLHQILYNVDNSTIRQIYQRSGVKFIFRQTGQIGRADAQTTIIQLVSALGLLSVATLVVELFMLYLLPNKKEYTKYKFNETEDFSDVRDLQTGIRPETVAYAQALQSDLQILRLANLPTE